MSTSTDDAVSPIAQRVGPPLAAVALLVTVALLAWLALAPTAIDGPLGDAPFTVPATLVVGPDDDGCLDLVDGDGSRRTHCLDELAVTDDGWTNVWFDEEGQVVVSSEDETGQQLTTVDPVSGSVLDRQERSWDEDPRGPIGEPPRARPIEVVPDGDRVLRQGTGPTGPTDTEDTTDAEVVLDLEAPPGYRLRDAVLSPDEAWVVVVTPDDLVAVAPTDGSAAPHVWAAVPDDRWVDLRAVIRWDG